MRRRDPNSMVISDDFPTDKPRFADRFGYSFAKLRQETMDWLSEQRVIMLPFKAGDPAHGYDSLLVCPANAAFFALALANMQGFFSGFCLSTVQPFIRCLCPEDVHPHHLRGLSGTLFGALAGRPSWVYYPDGLKKLKAHDEGSQVSYLETLRVYLDNNLSVTKTAAALYLHRSTLLDRLAHITQMLGCDLKDPDFCLTLGILLRAELQQKRIAQPKP